MKHPSSDPTDPTINLPKIPTPQEMPSKQQRFSPKKGGEQEIFKVVMKTITPIMGGGTEGGKVDEVDFIRAPTIRGHLRFWWRTLYGDGYEKNPKELYKRETALWGGATADESGGRSLVEITVQILEKSETDESRIQMSDPEGYALWPARKSRDETLARYKSGLKFSLRIVCPKASEREVQNSIRAWVLFGGYGSRTRRGVGSLTVVENQADWLPTEATGPALEKLFGTNILKPLSSEHKASDIPLLKGSLLYFGSPGGHAERCWSTAMKWLRDFRQAPSSGAREPDPDKGNRPSISNWPEADKVRQLFVGKDGPGQNKTLAHDPKHNAIPVWPRAGFGLPINGQFQNRNRQGTFWNRLNPPKVEPNEYEMRWVQLEKDEKGHTKRIVKERLSSPLILKAMPLTKDRFVPCALWLYRAYPEGKVIMGWAAGRGKPFSVASGSNADFDQLVAKGDTPHFSPLDVAPTVPEGIRLRTAFMDWIKTQNARDAWT